jgi:hypothetical protein
MKPKTHKKNGKNGTFDPQVFLDTAGNRGISAERVDLHAR